LNSSFDITSSDISNTADSSLLIEISGQGISFIVINADNHCTALSMYHFEAGTTHDKIAGYLKDIVAGQPVLQQPFKKVSFIYAFAASALVPHQFMNATTNKSMLELMYGDTSESIVRSDFINRHNVHNIYSVPKQVDWVIANLFFEAKNYHLYSLLAEKSRRGDNQLYCIVSTTQITVQLLKQGVLQIIQSFEYKESIDAVYHLLNICERFEVNLNETVVYLNGMIDANSNLYNELFKYFLHPVFAPLPEAFTYAEEIRKLPAHYFSHLFELATCV
jgi:hypothetical protein